MNMEETLHVAGIDFGNQNTICAIPRGSGVDICLNQSSNRITPSVVSYTKERRFYGDLSLQNQLINIKSTFTDLKKIIDLDFDSEEKEKIQDNLLYELSCIEEASGRKKVGVSFEIEGNSIVTPVEQVIAYLLKCCIEDIRKYDEKVNKIYLSVDSCWSNAKRQVLLNAARIIGIDCELVNSSVAAAIAFVMSHKDKIPQTKDQAGPVCIVDIGDSSMKACVALVSGESVDVISYAEDDTINGSTITDKFAKYLAGRVNEKYKIMPFDKPSKRISFRKCVEKTKKMLSVNPVVQFEFDAGDVYVQFQVKREELENLIQDEVNRLNDPIAECLKYASDNFHVSPRVIELIGGTARIPLFKEKIGQLGLEVLTNINADECIAAGCALFDAYNVTQRMPYPITAAKDDQTIELFQEMIEVPAGPLTLDVESGVVVIQPDNIQIDVKNTDGPNVILTRSCTFDFNNLGESVVYISGYMSDDSIATIQSLEKKLDEIDENSIKLDEEKNEMESALFKAERLLKDEALCKAFTQEEHDQAIQIVSEISKWHEEHEFDRMSFDEYRERKEILNEINERPTERIKRYEEMSALIPTLITAVNKILKDASLDRQRVDDGERSRLCGDCIEFIKNMDSIKNVPLSVDDLPDPNELKNEVEALANRLKELQQMPLVVKKVIKPQQRNVEESSSTATTTEDESISQDEKPKQQNPTNANRKMDQITKNFWPSSKKMQKKQNNAYFKNKKQNNQQKRSQKQSSSQIDDDFWGPPRIQNIFI